MSLFKKVDVRRPAGIAAITAACVLLSMIFFAPRLWLMRSFIEGSFQWDRGHTYLLQCEQPFRHDVEPAMRWRLLPPLLAHGFGLNGMRAFLLPWLGIVALVGYVAVLHARRLPDQRYVFGGTLLVATTSAVLVPVGWLGINDAWVWCGLLAAGFGGAGWAPPLACLLCPWIDERFLIGLPLAWTVRCVDRHESFFSRDLANIGWLIPYIAVRLLLGGNPATESSSSQFFAGQLGVLPTLITMAPLGWWMGLRLGWLAIGYAGVALSRHQRVTVGAVFFATLGITLFLASDISRSIATLLPLVLLGNFVFARDRPALASKAAMLIGCASLFIPAAHVVLNKIDPISPLPLELIRLFRAE